MKTINLTQGKLALVDDSDYEELNRYKWCAVKHRNGRYYAVRYGGYKGGKTTHILMHIEVMRAHSRYQSNLEVDHIDYNGLNNTTDNLRMVTHRGNAEHNRRNTSGFPGVSFDMSNNKWRAQAMINGYHYHIGYFNEAYRASIARRLFLSRRRIKTSPVTCYH